MIKRPLFYILLYWLTAGSVVGAELKTLQREYVPIKLAGARIPVSQFAFNDWRAFSYDATTGLWRQIPFQVDYRDAAGNYHGKPAPTILDANDELLLMPEDLGDRAPEKAWLTENGVRAARRVELELSEASDATQKGWLYLYPSTLQPAGYVFRHVNAPKGSGADTISTPSYVIGHNDHGWIDYLATAGQPQTDLIDRLKLRVAGKALDPKIGSYAATEDTLKGAGSISGSGDSTYTYWPGAVRVIKDVRMRLTVPQLVIINKNIDYPLFYYPYSISIGINNKQLENEYILSLAGAKLLRQSLDFSPAAAGMRFYTDANRAGVTIDGAADNLNTALAAQTGKQWAMASGAQGTLLMVLEMPATKNGATVLYYRDDMNGGTADETPDSGDKSSYGDVGLMVSAKSGSGLITNSVTMGFTLYVLPERDRNADFAERIFQWVQRDLQVKAVVLNDPGTGVEIPAAQPGVFRLGAGYPNPFNPMQTGVSWEIAALPVAHACEARVFNLLGQQVASWRVAAATSRTVLHWDGRDQRGAVVPQGVYFLQVQSGEKRIMNKVQVVY